MVWGEPCAQEGVRALQWPGLEKVQEGIILARAEKEGDVGRENKELPAAALIDRLSAVMVGSYAGGVKNA